MDFVDPLGMTKRFTIKDGDVIADENGNLFRVVALDESEAKTVRGLARLAATLRAPHEHACAGCGLVFRCELTHGCTDQERCPGCPEDER